MDSLSEIQLRIDALLRRVARLESVEQPHGFVRAVKTVTSAYTLTDNDGLIKADASGGAFTLTLPSAAARASRAFHVKRLNAGANAVTVGTTGGQTIDGAATKVIANQNDSYTFVSDGSNYQII